MPETVATAMKKPRRHYACGALIMVEPRGIERGGANRRKRCKR